MQDDVKLPRFVMVIRFLANVCRHLDAKHAAANSTHMQGHGHQAQGVRMDQGFGPMSSGPSYTNHARRETHAEQAQSEFNRQIGRLHHRRRGGPRYE